MNHAIYREEILEHYHSPLHYGALSHPTWKNKLTNPLCGDDIEIAVNIKNDMIEDIAFRGVGCAIAIASTSMLTDYLLHKPLSILQQMTEEDMLDFLQLPISETRKKCALLGFATIKELSIHKD